MSKTLEELELEAAVLGIGAITLIRRLETWHATAFMNNDDCIGGAGESVSEAYENMVVAVRGVAGARLARQANDKGPDIGSGGTWS